MTEYLSSTDILNNVYNGSELNMYSSDTDVLNAVYDPINSALKVNIANLPSGSISGSSGTQPSNEIIINVNDTEVVGKQYDNFTNAFTYIATQTPSATNTWAVRFSGRITENITVPEFVTVVGDDMYTSIINGSVSFEALGTQLLNTNNISNCTIGELIGTSTGTDNQYIGVDNCKILNASGTGSNGIIMNNCFVLGGDYSTFDKLCFVSNTFVIPLVGTATFVNAQLNSCLVYALSPGSLSFETSTINLSQCNFIKNYILITTNFNNCTLDVTDVIINSNIKLDSCTLNNILTISNASILSTHGCTMPGEPINIAGGSWDNAGDMYNNATTALIATNVQSAIDEIVNSTISSVKQDLNALSSSFADAPKLNDRYYVGESGSFTTIQDAITYLASGSNMTCPSEIFLDGCNENVTDTININLPYHLNIRGLDFKACTINAATGLTNKPMFNVSSSVFFERITFNGSTLANYGTLANENAIVLYNDNYHEFSGLNITNFYDGIKISGSSSTYLFNSIIENISNSGVHVNSIGSSSIDVETNTFTNCSSSVYLNTSSNGIFHIINNIFENTNTTDTAVVYTPATYTYTDSPSVSTNIWNNVGTFSTGFDYTRTDARDANIFVVGNSGREDKKPHGKINVLNNASATTITTPTTFYKAVYTNGSTYTCKFTLENNKITYQPTNKSDVMMWVSCNVITGQDNRNIDVAIVKNGNIALGLFGQMTVRATVQNQPFPISTPVYLPDVAAGDYFEIWVTNSGSGNVIVQDVSWLFDSK